MQKPIWIAIATLTIAASSLQASAQKPDLCPRPQPGSLITEPEDLRSHNGVLETQLTVNDSAEADGTTRYCYTDPAGHESPNLRVSPGDLVVLHLKNALKEPVVKGIAVPMNMHHAQSGTDPCTSGVMSAVSTNLHFHGLTMPPVCHQDDVMKTSVQPGDAPFEYRFRIPEDEPAGLYWYHPHIHGFSKQQLLGGESGALIVEGIEHTKKAAAGLPERVFIIRDQDLVHPDAQPAITEPVVPKFLIDRDGDAANNGTGFGKPAKDLSINYVPAPYPDYTPAIIQMRPQEKQL